MYQLPAILDDHLATLSKLFEVEGKRELQELIVNAKIRVDEGWSHDNWNGGITGHALYLTIPEQLFLKSIPQRDEIQDTIQGGLNSLNSIQDEFIDKVFLQLDLNKDEDWRLNSGLLLTSSRTVSSEAQSRIWADGSFRLFLSHKSKFKKETALLKEELRHFGVSCFVAHADIHPTEEWVDEILNALTTMDGFAALLTSDFHDSDWTDQEVGFAVARGVPRIGVMLGGNPYGFMARFQGLPTSWEKAACDIAGVLIKNDRMFSAYLHELRKCPNWIHANVLGGLLPKIISLSRAQIDELVATYNNTGELRGAFAFDGTKPTIHGPGLVSHLNRLDRRKYKFVDGNRVEIVAEASS